MSAAKTKKQPKREEKILSLIESAMKGDTAGAVAAAQSLAKDGFKKRIAKILKTQDLI